MWKKISTLLVAFTLLFSVTAPMFADYADAKPRYRSPSRSYTPEAPAQSPTKRTDNVDNGATNRAGTTTPGAAAGRTGFGGGGLMRGLMLGGLAGLMFGGLLAGLGAFGSLLGLLINVAAVILVIVLIRKAIRAFAANRNQPPRGDYR